MFEQVRKNADSAGYGLDYARSVAVSPDGRHVYAVGQDDDAVAVFSRNAASGKLTFVEMLEHGVGGVDGLNGAYFVMVSPDGGNVYVASYGDDAVAVFSRDSGNGALTFVEVITDTAPGVDGLAGATSMAISPDGLFAYVAGYLDDAVAVFSRNAVTGRLTFEQVIKDTDSGVDGLDSALNVALSSNGEHLYVTGYLDDAVAVFSRDRGNGRLTFEQVIKDTDSGVDGLNGARGLALSLDGRHVYVTGQSDDAVVVFSRNSANGELTFVQVIKDTDEAVDGLNGAYSVTVSPDGRHVYAAGYVDDAVVVFSRDADSGTLTFKQVLKDGVDGLDGALDVALSPDGRHVYVASYVDDAVAVFSREGGGSPPGTHRVFVGNGQIVNDIDFGNTILNVNDAPTNITLTNAVSSLFETADTRSATKIADIVITDADGGTNAIVLSGADAASFVVEGSELYFKAGTALDYETKTSYAVTLTAGSVSIDHTLEITNRNDLPIGAVTIAGTATEGLVLTADVSTLADEDGLGTMTYEWNRSGIAIPGATGATYTLTQADVGETMTVTASYIDGQGTPESMTSAPTAAVESSDEIPEILIGPQSHTLSHGQNLALLVVATSSEVLSYQWRKDGVDIPGATNSILALVDVNRGASGIYSVVVSNSAGSSQSTEAVLRVLVPQRLEPPEPVDGGFILRSGDHDGYALQDADKDNFIVQESTDLVQWTIVTPEQKYVETGKVTFIIPSPGITQNETFSARSLRVIEEAASGGP